MRRVGRAAARQMEKMGNCSLLQNLKKAAILLGIAQRLWENRRLKSQTQEGWKLQTVFLSVVSAFELCLRSMAAFSSEGKD